MKVRKGNDIRLKVQLTYENGEANVHFAKAIFVNRTLKDNLVNEYQKKTRFIGRFPTEPFVNEFEPSEYNINSCGQYPKYKAFVVNQYNGFGVRPNWKKCAPIKDVNITEYCGKVYHTTAFDTIEALFPGEAQLYSGVYDLIVIADVFDNGYDGNKRTVTTRLNNVFELVDDSMDQEDITDNPVKIEIVNTEDTENVPDTYIIGGQYDNNSIRLTRNDSGVIDINVAPISGWYIDGAADDQEQS